MPVRIRPSYAKSGDVDIAWAEFGEGPVNLVFVTGFVGSHRTRLGGAAFRALLRAHGLLRARGDVRQAWPGAVGPAVDSAHARGAHGRHARRDGRGRDGAGVADGHLGGRSGVDSLRRHAPGPRELADPLRNVCTDGAGGRLPRGIEARDDRAVHRRLRAGLGRSGGAPGVRSLACARRAAGGMVGTLPAPGHEPVGRQAAAPALPRHGRAGGAADDLAAGTRAPSPR